MTKKLAQMKCAACSGAEPPLSEEEIRELMPNVPTWEVVAPDGVQQLQRTFKFPNFAEALAFVNRVGAAAEVEGHHPVIEFTWGRVLVAWYTHEINGLHENDFIMAAKTDALLTSGWG